MPEKMRIRLDNAEKTQIAGESLAKSIYNTPLTILLNGELGAGKTTFLQGFAKGLNVSSNVISPTYAIEQRYETPDFGEFLHIDIYRLSPADGKEIVEASDDHEGIRCIEWADKLKSPPSAEHTITIHLKEIDDGNARVLEIEFDDISIPSDKEINEWRKEVMLNDLAISHCDAVADLSEKFANHFLKQGIITRPNAIKAAGALHDLFRFVDFPIDQLSDLNIDVTDEQLSFWNEIKEKSEGKHHEAVVADFLRDNKFAAIAKIIESHGLKPNTPEPITIEEKLLHYSDKRVKFDKVVSLDERFDDFRERYQKGKSEDKWEKRYDKVRDLEKELFPEGPPF